jgi:hypothetical protein
MRIGFLIAGIALAALAVLGLNYFFGEQAPEPDDIPPDPVAVVPADPTDAATDERAMQPALQAPPPPVVAEPALVLPTLDQSDPFVRETLAEGGLPEDWLGRNDLLRRLAVVIENGARGVIPRRQLDFLAPEGKFAVRKDGEQLFLDPAGYARYDVYLDTLESVPAETLARLLTDAAPLLERAIQELGVTDGFMPRLRAAIEQVQAVPELTGDIELLQPRVYYEYADPALEGLSELQKQVLRTGPENTRRLKRYLQALQAGLGPA